MYNESTILDRRTFVPSRICSRSNKWMTDAKLKVKETQMAAQMAPDPRLWLMNVEEYLQLDDASLDVRYEYYDGHIRAMAGGTAAHSRIKINMIKALDEGLTHGPCRAFDVDMRVQISE